MTISIIAPLLIIFVIVGFLALYFIILNAEKYCRLGNKNDAELYAELRSEYSDDIFNVDVQNEDGEYAFDVFSI